MGTSAKHELGLPTGGAIVQEGKQSSPCLRLFALSTKVSVKSVIASD